MYSINVAGRQETLKLELTLAGIRQTLKLRTAALDLLVQFIFLQNISYIFAHSAVSLRK